jgi:hypothetical protein
MKTLLMRGLRRSWPLLVLGGALVLGVTAGLARLQWLVRQQLPGLLKGRLEAALGRRVEFGTLHLWPTGVWINSFRVVKSPQESEDPLSAARLRASVDIWALLSARQVRVTGVDLDGMKLRLPAGAGAPGGASWTAQVLALSRSGIRQFRVHDASLRVLRPRKGAAAWAAEGVEGSLSLQPASFGYRAHVTRLDGKDIAFTGVRLAGTGDAEGIRLDEGQADYGNGRVRADGTLKAAGSQALMTLHADNVPLGKLAAQMGIPAQWAVNGQVSGEMTVDARDNSLRRVRGAVSVNRGSLRRDGSEFPWESARAAVDWSPARTLLSGVRVSGKGLLLTAGGDVVTRGRGLASGLFHVFGNLAADGTETVAQVAQLLAFRRVLDGRWEAGNASARFTATGTVGDLAGATASGRLTVDRLRFRPTAGKDPVTVNRFEADLERGPAQFSLRNVKAQTEGLTLAGQASLTDDRPGKPGQFRASGKVDAKDLKSLRAALPQVTLWDCVPVASPAASGSVTFRLGGPTASPSRFWSEGQFEVKDFRLGLRSPLPSGAMFFIPMHRAGGSFRHADGRLQVTDLDLKARTFEATGQVAFTFGKGDPQMVSDLRVRTDDWRSLPAMPVGVLPELQGGRLEATLRSAGPYSALSEAPVSGSFRLADAVYAPAQEGAAPIPITALAAQFDWKDRVLDLPALSVQSPVVTASARGKVSRDGGEYRVTLDVDASTADAGALAGRFSRTLRLAGGAAETRLHVESPVKQFGGATLSGALHLRDVKALHPVEALGLAQVDARKLDLEFSRKGGRWEVAGLSLEGPGLSLALSGSLDGQEIDAAVKLRTESWRGPASLPLAGGKLALDGRVTGDLWNGETLAFVGEVALDGARARYKGAKLGVEGGVLDLKARGEGPVSDLTRWLRAGTILLKNARATPEGQAPRNVDLASAEVARDGEVLRVKNARVGGEGVDVRGSGDWSHTGYHLTLIGDARRLDGLGIKLPTGVRAARYHVQATLSGSGETPILAADGRLDVDGAMIALEGAPSQAFERLGSGFHYADGRLRFENLEGRSPAGTLKASGEWSAAAHHLALTLEGKDAAGLGLKLPEGVAVRSYRLTAAVAGTGEKAIATAEGRLELEGIRVALDGAPAQAFDRVAGDFRYAEGRVQVADVEGHGAAGVLKASGEWSPAAHRIRLSLAGEDFARLGIALPEGFGARGYALDAELSGTAARPLSTGAGRVQVAGARFAFGPGEPHVLDTVSGRFTLGGGRIALSGLRGDGPAGHYTGSGEVSAGTYRLAFQSQDANPDVARWLVPGTVLGGGLAGTVVLEGRLPGPGARPEELVQAASGHFDLTGARYVLPVELQLDQTPAAVSRFAGEYRWENNRAVLTGMVLHGDLLEARGKLSATESDGEVQAEFTTRDLGAVAGYWPMLAGRLRGGNGAGKVSARFDPTSARGVLELRDTGGTLLLPSVPAEYAEHPVQQASMVLDFEPGKLAFKNVTLRGPKGNADGEGTWTAAGPVFGKGKAWFSKGYTAKMLKPTGWGWLAKLAGIREVKTDFALGGTADRVMLNAGITRGTMWKFAKGQVPREFQDVAAGKSPLWAAPPGALEAVAEAADGTSRSRP